MEEAGLVAGVADGSGWVRFDEDDVVVTVLPDFPYLEVVTGGFTFVPEFLSAAAVEPDVGAGEGAADGFLVHVGEHEDIAGVGVLDDGWNESFFVEFHVVYGYLTPFCGKY